MHNKRQINNTRLEVKNIFIDEFYYGNIDPQETEVMNNKEFKRRMQQLCDTENKLRNELKKLTGNDFMLDESGIHWCVRVKLGKCGKKNQLNRLNSEEDVEFVRKYFEGKGPDELIFPPEAFKNHLNLHKLRAESAKEYYNIQIQKIKENPEYAKQLEREILDRWNKYNINPKTGKPRYFDRKQIEGYWVLRGKNREKARALGNDGRYLKLVVLATSIFKLSHWRNDTTIFSYLNI